MRCPFCLRESVIKQIPDPPLQLSNSEGYVVAPGWNRSVNMATLNSNARVTVETKLNDANGADHSTKNLLKPL